MAVHSTPVFLPGKSHRMRSPASYSPWCCKELNMTEGISTAQHSGIWNCGFTFPFPNDEYLFMCLFTVCVLPLLKDLFKSLAYF